MSGDQQHLALSYRAANLARRTAAYAEGRRPPDWLDKPKIANRVQLVWSMRVAGKTPQQIARDLGVHTSTVYNDLELARDLAAYTMAGEIYESILTQIERHRAAQQALWTELEMLATVPIPAEERGQAIIEGRPLRRWTSSYPQRAMAVATLIDKITSIERTIEELSGMRTRAGTPDMAALRAIGVGQEDGLGDSPVVFNFDFRTQTIQTGRLDADGR